MVGSKLVLRQILDNSAKRAAVFLAAEVRTGIQRQAPGGQRFVPLHEFTKAKKGSSKALIDTGHLRRSIKEHKISHAAYLVGVHRNTRAATGDPLVNIAAVHEFGAHIRVTPRMRSYLHAQGLHLKPDTEEVVIPPRPYLFPTFHANRGRIERMVADQSFAWFEAAVR